MLRYERELLMISEEEKSQVRRRKQRGNAILFHPDSTSLSPLFVSLESQHKRAVVLWALECAEEACSRYEQMNPHEGIPREAIRKSRSWARGEIKLSEARKAILACHALAKREEQKEGIALLHAIAQACSTVHARRHALAFPLYRLTALVHQEGEEVRWDMIETAVAQMQERLGFWRSHADDAERVWAAFLPARERGEGER